MSKYRFAVSNLESRHEGIVESDSFTGAIHALAEHISVARGDVLEIGVHGFPPALYECVATSQGSPFWMPRLAA